MAENFSDYIEYELIKMRVSLVFTFHVIFPSSLNPYLEGLKESISFQKEMIGLLEINKSKDFWSSSQLKLVTFFFLFSKESFVFWEHLSFSLERNRAFLFCSLLCAPY